MRGCISWILSLSFFFLVLFFLFAASRTVAANVVAGAGYFDPPIDAAVLRGELLGVPRYIAKRREKKKRNEPWSSDSSSFLF